MGAVSCSFNRVLRDFVKMKRNRQFSPFACKTIMAGFFGIGNISVMTVAS